MYVAECFLYGDSFQSYNVAVVHPHMDILMNAAKKLGINETDPKKLTENKKIEELVLEEMTAHGKR